MPTENNQESAPCFPEASAVLVWCPPRGADGRDRSRWARALGLVVSRRCVDEWCIGVGAPERTEPGLSVPDGDAPENLPYPLCVRTRCNARGIRSHGPVGTAHRGWPYLGSIDGGA
jgi:hypothetical protein